MVGLTRCPKDAMTASSSTSLSTPSLVRTSSLKESQKDPEQKKSTQAKLDTVNRRLMEDRNSRYTERGLQPPTSPLNPQELTQSPETSPMLKVGDVVDGYKFKGGNPNDKNNWAKE